MPALGTGRCGVWPNHVVVTQPITETCDNTTSREFVASWAPETYCPTRSLRTPSCPAHSVRVPLYPQHPSPDTVTRSTLMASDAAHLPPLVPKTSRGPNLSREDTARRKSASKSRNGMFVFVSHWRCFEIGDCKTSAGPLVLAVEPCMLYR